MVLAVVLAACTPPAPVTVPEPTQAPDAQVQSQARTFEVLLSELYEHFLVSGPGAAQYISSDATPAQAAAELKAAVGLGDQATRFALATGTELARTAAAATTPGRVTEVEFEVRDVEVLGDVDGRLIVATTVWHQRAVRQGPTHEQTVTFAVGWRGEELDSVAEVLSSGSVRGLDSGSGLRSPLGAVRRYVELVEARAFDAVAQLSGGANTDAVALDVLASVVGSSESIFVVALPQATEGSAHVVYLINASGMVIGRFEVKLARAGSTEVVYYATA